MKSYFHLVRERWGLKAWIPLNILPCDNEKKKSWEVQYNNIKFRSSCSDTLCLKTYTTSRSQGERWMKTEFSRADQVNVWLTVFLSARLTLFFYDVDGIKIFWRPLGPPAIPCDFKCPSFPPVKSMLILSPFYHCCPRPTGSCKLMTISVYSLQSNLH